jgi:N-acetylglucosaminyldiphosphoundecaprenol N-acetyl-beta-D-mannosaminyltransferase
MSDTIFSFKFSTLSFSDTIQDIIELAKKKVSAYVCVSNVHMTVEASQDPSFAEVLHHADRCVLDGMPLCWAFNSMHGFKPERIAGRHLLHALLLEASAQGLPVLFYGSTVSKLALAEKFLIENYPNLQIAGMISPPFRSLTFKETSDYRDQINQSGARLVFVALGCPKQEIWMNQMKGQIQATMLGIGIAMEVLTGQQKSTPTWMENAGLEWLFRLYKEPRRLGNRYFVTNSKFIWMWLTYLIFNKNNNNQRAVFLD